MRSWSLRSSTRSWMGMMTMSFAPPLRLLGLELLEWCWGSSPTCLILRLIFLVPDFPEVLVLSHLSLLPRLGDLGLLILLPLMIGPCRIWREMSLHGGSSEPYILLALFGFRYVLFIRTVLALGLVDLFTHFSAFIYHM